MLQYFKFLLLAFLLGLSPMLMAEPVDINSATAARLWPKVSGVLMAEPVDINSATAAELSKALSGVGASKAKAIVEYRDKNGPFKSADELKKVKGIGKATVEKNRAVIVVGGAPSAAPPAAPATATAPPPVAPAAAPVPAAQ